MTRRGFSLLAIAALAGSALASLGTAGAEEPLKELRLGYQKNGVLVVARQQERIEKRFADQGMTVKWVEFASGPPLLEALSLGAIDFGPTGDAPPIFAQAANAKLVYVASYPAPGTGSAILVKQDSPIKTIEDLKGKTIGFTKGSSANNFVVQTLKKAGIGYDQIKPAYLSPADGGAAFVKGAIDAWAIWDPFYAIAERTQHPRVLTTAEGIVNSASYFFANRDFAAEHPAAVKAIIEELTAAGAWAEENRDQVAAALSAATGVDIEAQKLTAARGSFKVGPITPQQIANQQQIADTFYELKLIPRKITVKDAVWVPPQS
ncbi:sulfonate ABC transporter substrate-binding protein [Kaistia dalseonensis]|uniref:sulfonate ABC transporter substrate-binding protein n=1 Tax=Kaistia dalseonensis TaxID=410840 RepID=UPI002252E775|nr:sulfonate ABC transporter substrate-binding protein [Kaistia dalseonensis]